VHNRAGLSRSYRLQDQTYHSQIGFLKPHPFPFLRSAINFLKNLKTERMKKLSSQESSGINGGGASLN